MIENRMRLEREIMRGRESVRRDTRSGIGVEGGLKAPLQQNRVGKLGLKGVGALPIESEAEQEFAEGSQRFFKRPRTLGRGIKSPRMLLDQGPSKDGDNQFPRVRANRPEPDNEANDQLVQSVALNLSELPEHASHSLFRGWRTRSFPAIPSPFRSRQGITDARKERVDTGAVGWQSEDWSSSSSGDIDFQL